ncbi:hypothetical protein [Streptomyces venezuelae]|nr:hypothetical protein [Streptomyces venezuelae]
MTAQTEPPTRPDTGPGHRGGLPPATGAVQTERSVAREAWTL